ncbi:MAG: DNA repair protein RadC [Candidatus Nanohaloarchaea archaeon]
MDYTIKELPEQERPREKLEERGASRLTEVELLSLVLRTGIEGKNVKELAGEILDDSSLAELGNRKPGELEKFDGVSSVKAGQLVAVGELARRMQVEERDSIDNFSSAREQVEDMKYLEKEKLRAFYLSSGNEVLKKKEFEGGVDSVQVSTRELLEPAVRENVVALVIAHNHPSGRAEPTGEDVKFTEELKQAASTLDIEVLDHLIVGETVSSMRGSGAAEFPD